MNSSLAGLSVRFFNVTIPTGPDRKCKFTGRALSPSRFPLSRSAERDRTARKRPVARRAVIN
jgi:hypothetical protein